MAMEKIKEIQCQWYIAITGLTIRKKIASYDIMVVNK